MKICIDTRSPGYSGIFTYTTNLLRSLQEIDKENEYMILSDSKGKWELNGFEERVIPTNNPLGWMIWSNTELPKILKNEKVDIYHSVKHVTALRGNVKKVITFHSADYFLYPQQYRLYDLAYWRIMHTLAAKKYDYVITVSEADKRNYIKYIDVPENKFRVIHVAADKERFQVIRDNSKLKDTKEKFGLPERFILFVGRLLPVKNIETIIKAYHLAKKKKKIEHKLVLVGKKTRFCKKIVSLVKELDIVDDVIFTGPIFNELPYIYNLADLFLLPSYYESFSQVLLEAMVCGVPVIASNRGGMPEVVGDAGILVSPTNVEELADAIIQILSSNSLRQTMIQKGLERASLFSWEHCARETLKVYEELRYT